jgi:outer membrane lipopolysaccharide assembly protein LptE/RlpB
MSTAKKIRVVQTKTADKPQAKGKSPEDAALIHELRQKIADLASKKP